MVSNGKCDVGASKITSEILEIVANLPKSVEALTGIDISKVSDIKSETLFWLNYVDMNCTSDVRIFGWILLWNLLRIKGSDFSIHELVLTLFITSWIDLIHNTRFLCMRLKTDVTWFLRGRASDKIILPIEEIMVEFVYSRQQLNENLFP